MLDLDTVRVINTIKYQEVISVSNIFTLELSKNSNFILETTDAEAKSIIFSIGPKLKSKVLTVKILLLYTNAAVLTFPKEVNWNAPAFTVYNNYLISLKSNDNGASWMASLLDTWPYKAITLSADYAAVGLGETTNPVISVDPVDVILSYSSGNSDIVAVNTSTGVITGISAGSTTITITASKQGWIPSIATVAVNVTAELLKPSSMNTGPFNTSNLTQLTGYQRFDEAGKTYENFELTDNTIYITASNITLRNFKVSSLASQYHGIRVISGCTGVIIEYGEVDMQGGGNTCILLQGSATVRYMNLHNCDDGIHAADNSIIEYNWFHDMGQADGAHADGVQSEGGYNTIIRYNNFDMPASQEGAKSNSAIILKAYSSIIDGFIIENNWMNAGNYTIYLLNSNYLCTNTIVRNNRIGRDYLYGIFSTNTLSYTWSGNVWDDTGLPADLPSISLSCDPVEIINGGTGAIELNVYPADSTLSYSSNDTSVVAVNSITGELTAVASGKTTMTITANKPGYTSTSIDVAVTVSTESVTPGFIVYHDYSLGNSNDQSVNGNNGTLFGNPVYDKTGLLLDAVDDYIRINKLFITRDFTIVMFIKPGASQASYATLFNNRNTSAQGISISQSGTAINKYYCKMYTGVGEGSTVTAQLTADIWQCLSFTRNNTALSVSVNTVEKSKAIISANNIVANPGAYAFIGSSQVPAAWWKGNFGIFLAYDKALTPSELLQTYSALKSKFGL